MLNFHILKEMKKLILLLVAGIFLLNPHMALAEDKVCSQVYGGGVICGVHTPVNTGIADNLGLVGIGLIATSGMLFFVSKKIKKSQI
jgi:hypothetical protein